MDLEKVNLDMLGTCKKVRSNIIDEQLISILAFLSCFTMSMRVFLDVVVIFLSPFIILDKDFCPF